MSKIKPFEFELDTADVQEQVFNQYDDSVAGEIECLELLVQTWDKHFSSSNLVDAIKRKFDLHNNTEVAQYINDERPFSPIKHRDLTGHELLRGILESGWSKPK